MAVSTATRSPLTFSAHVAELRVRVAWCVGAVALSAVVGYISRGTLINFLQKPLHEPLYYTNPAGSFNFIMKISFFAGVVVALPIFVCQAVRFIEPALQIKIKTSTLLKLIVAIVIMALLGVAFAYFIIVPISLQFFAKYSSGQLQPLITADSYLNFIIACLVTFALMFQLPLLILFINRHITPLKPRQLLRYQRHIIIGAFVLAVIMPFTYDPISQFAMALPVVFLFYLSVILLAIVHRHNRATKLVLPLHYNTELEGASWATTAPEPTPSTAPQLDGAHTRLLSLDGVHLPHQAR